MVRTFDSRDCPKDGALSPRVLEPSGFWKHLLALCDVVHA